MNETLLQHALTLSKREFYAAIAMQGLLASGLESPARVARDAVRCADALIQRLDNPQLFTNGGYGEPEEELVGEVVHSEPEYAHGTMGNRSDIG